MDTKDKTKMVDQIEAISIEGNDPIVVIKVNKKIVLVLEEFKLFGKVPENNIYPKEPNMSKQVVKSMYNITEFTETTDRSILKDIKNKYLGMGYNNDYIYETIKKNGLFYMLYDSRYTIPKDYFKDVIKLLKLDKKIGWFQQKNKIGKELDFNRCIIENKKYKNKYEKNELPKEISDYTVFHRIIKEYNAIPLIETVNMYNPIQAINKLKNKKFDVLCIANLICFRGENECPIK